MELSTAKQILSLLADGIAYLCHLAALPMIWLGLLCKKLIKIAKNIFHYGRRWYKIRLIPGEMETLKRNQGAEKGEKGRGKDKKGGSAHKNRRTRSADLPGDFSSESAGTDRLRPGGAGRPEPA